MKKALAFVLAFTMATAVFAGCAKKDASKEENKESTNKESTVSKEPVTLKVFMSASTNKVQPDKMPFYIDLQEKTGVKLDFEAVTQNANERVSLIFASGEFPDIMFKGATETQVAEAVEGGQIVSLDEPINKYSPTWKKLLEKDAYVKKMSVSKDGKIWALPQVRQEESNSGIRDLVLINKTWLNELGLQMPKTTDDFYNVLKAFKDNAGKGSIPKNVIPWAVRFNQYANGGEYELYSSFGVFTPGSTNFMSVDEKGKVVFSAVNPKMKDALKYFNKLYKEGLIMPEMFTDNVSAYDSKVLMQPPMVGVASRYYGLDIEEKNYTAMPPLYGPNGEKPMFRQQINAVQRNAFIVFKNNKYLPETMKVAEYIAQPENSILALYGPVGTHVTKTGSGYSQVNLTQDMLNIVPDANLPIVVTEETMKGFTYNGLHQQRAEYIKNVYKEFIAPIERFYPALVFTSEQSASIQNIQTDLLNYIKQTHAHWIVDGNIDAEWDGYIKKINDLKLDNLLKIYQEALDSFNGVKK